MGNVKHVFTSPKADGGDATLIRPSNWNAAHEGAVEILDRDLTQIEVVNTAGEISIYSYSIGADVLGITGGVRLSLGGDYLNNSGTNKSLTIRAKLGATTVFSRAFQTVTSADRRKWLLNLWFLNSAAAAQKWSAEWYLSPALADVLAIGTSGSEGGAKGAGVASSTEDTTGGLTLDITMEHSAAAATLSIRKEIALLELIPAS
ncbi:hypothetical protein LCGC14_2619940 [marine sediment metagenome]|uniref:Uncharacterized protein n=1 Tax=marine sediment metagenome TaxID=412755 RepID=A0A0F9CEC8_9ZZZZ